MLKVHPDAEGAHYTIRTLGKDGKEKNTTAEHISKVFALSDLGKATNLVDALFGLEMEEEFKCEESGESKVWRGVMCVLRAAVGRWVGGQVEYPYSYS